MDDGSGTGRNPPGGAARAQGLVGFGSDARRLRTAARTAAAAHALAGLAMLVLLRPGLGTTPFEDRIRYLAESRLAWWGGWIAWTVAALTILVFAIAARGFIAARNPAAAGRARTTVWVIGAAVAFDVGSQAVAALVLPLAASRIAAGLREGGDLFHLADAVMILGSGGVANALYTIATLMIAADFRNRVRPGVNITAAAILVSGTALTVSALLGSVPGMVGSNVVLVPAIVFWLLGVAAAAAESPL